MPNELAPEKQAAPPNGKAPEALETDLQTILDPFGKQRKVQAYSKNVIDLEDERIKLQMTQLRHNDSEGDPLWIAHKDAPLGEVWFDDPEGKAEREGRSYKTYAQRFKEIDTAKRLIWDLCSPGERELLVDEVKRLAGAKDDEA